MIRLDEVPSTNTWVLEALAKGTDLPDGTVVWTTRQTAGRGQVGNAWESEPDRNVSFSVLLRPTFLPPREQFVLSEIAALAVADETGGNIKWPNDIYMAEGKVCGILIEHRIVGTRLSESVVGIGINVNQTQWVGDAPNPTSLRLQTGRELSPEAVMDGVVSRLMADYRRLKADPESASADIHRRFCARLYRREGFYPYRDVATGQDFEACIKEVEPTGQLHLLVRGPESGFQGKTGVGVEETCGTSGKANTESGLEERVYWFKEVKFILPCGVVKE